MPQTLCPSCGHSPIPRGAEACPSCHEPFEFLQMYKRGQRKRVDRQRDSEEMEQTVFGGNITGEVTAHPGPIVAVFFVGAVAWFLRAGGVLGNLNEPIWVYGLVALDLVLGLVLLLNLGPAKLLAQVGMVLQLMVAGFLARAAPLEPVHLAYMAHAVVALVSVVGEPGPVRRYAGLGLGVVAALLGAVFLVRPMGPVDGAGGDARQLLVGRDLGYQLELPAGWGRLPREQLAPHLTLPLATLTGSGVGFGDAAQGRYGALWVDRGASQPVTADCQALLKAFGGDPSIKPSTKHAPLAMGTKALVYELSTGSGARGTFSCGKLADGRLVGFAVVAAPPDATGGESAFVAVGAGLALQ
ncbi:zinc ribbon domain-containing protein [Hyalangium rubrum]|uniref:Zinc ribbon domain-containing protein n=1 Tax=Hyalangium rubrum TaxID=3103134 RepID=A0ABU5H5Z6_9BACT|nr:zinc ribbon domain-containing protein [Hyalangium sp. s54d21]MDY7228908.1 zinc ribbon domain-containing protein [Hyalangium sp. s54d21]